MKAMLSAKRLIKSDGFVESPVIAVEDGFIRSIETRASTDARVTHDFLGDTLTSGFFDIHMHGAWGHDVMEANPDALHTISAYLARSGVTEYLATTVTASLDTTFRALEGIASYMRQEPLSDAARIAGIHIEGPFVSHAKKGMHPAEYIVPPSVKLLEQFWEASGGIYG